MVKIWFTRTSKIRNFEISILLNNTSEVQGTEAVNQESFLMLLQPIFIFSVPTPHELAPAASEYLGSSRNSLSNIYSRKLIFLINSSYEPLKNYEQLKMENFHSNKWPIKM